MNWLQFGITIVTMELPFLIKSTSSRAQLLAILLPLQMALTAAIAQLQAPTAVNDESGSGVITA